MPTFRPPRSPRAAGRPRPGSPRRSAARGIERFAFAVQLNGGNMKHPLRNVVAALALAASPTVLAQQGPGKIIGLVGLWGTGATAGTNFDNGVKLAVKEINASGGILGRKVDYQSWDTQ